MAAILAVEPIPEVFYGGLKKRDGITDAVMQAANSLYSFDAILQFCEQCADTFAKTINYNHILDPQRTPHNDSLKFIESIISDQDRSIFYREQWIHVIHFLGEDTSNYI